MGLGSAIAIYFVIWWVTLFAVLPFGVRTQGDVGDVVPGAPESAPSKIDFRRIAWRNTIVASVVFAGLYWLMEYSGLTLEDIPLPFPEN